MTQPAQGVELARLPEFEKAVLRVRELSLWYGATQALKPHEWPLPVLRDADGVAHYPPGEVTVRFVEVPTDPALSRFARSQGVTLIRRNALEPRQAVFIPSPPAREWLFDLIDRLAAAPGIARVWANTESLYRRA